MAMLNPKEETLSREELTALQSERLVRQVKRMYEKVECFRNRNHFLYGLVSCCDFHCRLFSVTWTDNHTDWCTDQICI